MHFVKSASLTGEPNSVKSRTGPRNNTTKKNTTKVMTAITKGRPTSASETEADSSRLLSPSDLTSKLEQLGDYIGDLKESAIQVAKRIVEIVDGYAGDGIELITQRYPDLSRGALERLEAIGRGNLLPEFALDSSVAAFHIAKLPMATQAMIIRDGVEVLKVGGVHRKPYQALSYQECSQAFEGDHLRSVEEQRAYLKQGTPYSHKPRYSIDTELAMVVFHQNCRFKASELEPILERLKALELRKLEADLKKAQVTRKK